MKRSSTIELLLIALLTPAGLGHAALITSSWIGGGSGNWNVAGNWSPSGVPNNGANTFDVIIDGNGALTVNVTLNMNATITSLTIDSGDALSIANNYDLRVIGASLVNNGLMTLDSTSTYTQLHAGPDLTISGSGEIAMGSSTYNRIVGTAYGNRLTNGSAHTISGGGQLGADVIVMTNNGLIDADQAQELVVDLNAGAASFNSGTMRASAGRTMRVLNSIFDNTGGLLQALNGSTVLVQNSTFTNGEVSTSGSGVVRGWGDAVFSGILNSGFIQGPNNTNTYFSGTITNNGQIALASTGNYSQLLAYGSPTTFQGSGEIVLGPDAHNRIGGSATGTRLVNSAGHTIRGSGALGIDALVLTNDGLVGADAAVPLVVDLNAGGTNFNSGTMQSSNGATLHLLNSVMDNTDGVVAAMDASTVLVQNSTITSGEVSTAGSGVVRGWGDAAFSGILNSGFIQGSNNTNTYFSGTITNNGQIALASTGSYTQLVAHGSPTTFQGSGEIVLGPDVHNLVTASIDGTRLVNAVNHTIRGGGALGNEVLVLTNDGLIQADAAVPLVVDLDAGGANHNSGTMQASGATLKFLNTLLDNSGGLIRALDGSTVDVQNSTIQYGELASEASGEFRLLGDAVLDDLVSSANIVCINNTNSHLRNTITNGGTILMDATANYTQLLAGSSTTTLGGSGTLSMGNLTYNRITGQEYGYRLVNGPEHTIRGAGQLGVDVIDITNQGTIIADLSAGYLIDANAEFLNQGMLHVTSAGGVTINPGSFINSGQITIDATRTLTRYQTYTQTDGTTLVNGTLSLLSGGTLQLQGGALKGAGTITGPVSNSGGVVEPGTAVGTLNISGTYAQSMNGTLRIEIGGTAAGAYDALSVFSTSSLDGALEIVPTGGFTPSPGNTFTILTASAVTGEFNAVSGSGEYCVTYAPTAVTVSVVSPCPADIACDRQVNVNDLLDVINNWGVCPNCPPVRCLADIDPVSPPRGDCAVDVNDLLLVINHWGPCP